jgi:hypothetical protein
MPDICPECGHRRRRWDGTPICTEPGMMVAWSCEKCGTVYHQTFLYPPLYGFPLAATVDPRQLRLPL